MASVSGIQWPEGKDFGFSIFDDADCGSLERITPIYELLRDCGLRTTKSVWPLDDPKTPPEAGPTCEEAKFLSWVRQLAKQGFEVGCHGASAGKNRRERIALALDRFVDAFGSQGLVFANHAGNAEAIYFHESRVSGAARWAYGVLTRFKTWGRSEGHIGASQYF